MNKFSLILVMATTVSSVSVMTHAASRDYIEIVGSSTVYPFVTVVNFSVKLPIIRRQRLSLRVLVAVLNYSVEVWVWNTRM